MQDKVVSPFMMGKFMDVRGELRNKVSIENNTFLQAHAAFLTKKKADAIRRRFHEKKRQLHESKGQLDQILHIPLLNLCFHLHGEKRTVFCEWVLLNQSIQEEVPDCGGLRMISVEKDNLLYKELESEHKPGFLQMSAKDEASLEVHKRSFKEEKRRYAVVSFALKTFSEDVQNWRPAHQSISYYRERALQGKRKEDPLDELLTDLIKVYILDSLTSTMNLIMTQQGELAVRILTGAAIACY